MTGAGPGWRGGADGAEGSWERGLGGGAQHPAQPRSPAAAQMVVTDLSAPAERPAALGRLGLCFGVGVILGSLLGGTLNSACG